jgi:outer membrane protein
VSNLKSFVLSLVLVASVLSVNASANDKIAVIDIQSAMFASDYAQNRVQASLESADFVALKAKAEGSAADLQAMSKKAEAERFAWSDEQLAEHQKKMSYTKADYDLAVQKLQGEQQALQQKILQDLTPTFQKALSEVVAEENITLLFRAESVLIANPQNNLTAKVVDRLNKLTSTAAASE